MHFIYRYDILNNAMQTVNDLTNGKQIKVNILFDMRNKMQQIEKKKIEAIYVI